MIIHEHGLSEQDSSQAPSQGPFDMVAGSGSCVDACWLFL